MALAVLLALAPGAAGDRRLAGLPERAVAPDSVLAIVWRENIAVLGELDPRSLQPSGGRQARLGSYDGAGWSFSPDRSWLALGGGIPSLRLVDLGRMRVSAALRLGGRGSAIPLSWPRRDRLLAMVEWGAFGRALVVADPLRGRVVARHRLIGTLSAQALAGNAVVALLGPASSIGPSRLAVVDADGGLRSAAVARVQSGLLPGGDTGALVSRYRTPGLAVSPDGRRAAVVDPTGLVAEVELESMAVRYHELGEPISLLGRLRNWLEPPAYAKASDGPFRRAVWLDDFVVAVSGMNARAGVDASGSLDERDDPAGLKLIDSRTWTVRTLDPAASGFSVTGELVLAYGALWDPSGQRFKGAGLAAYSRDGRPGFRLLRGEAVSSVQTAGRYAYAVVERGGPVLDSRLYVVDLVSGRVLGELKADERAGMPTILSGS